MYFITRNPTPILNTPDFRSVFGESLPFDEQKLVREIEMIALPGMILQVVKEEEEGILQVKSKCYPSQIPLYVDKRAGEFSQKEKTEKKILPPIEVVVERLKSKIGTPYVWGGNYSEGIPEWTRWYPPRKKLSVFEETHWIFRGVDCSGLLYEATDGFTPRNTSELMKFGEEVLLKDVKPLDMILYPGHVIIVLNQNELIESNHEEGGVVITPLEKRVSEIKRSMMVHRFHPDAFQIP